MKTYTPQPPPLATLDQQATWRNRAGRVDRSACFTLTAAQLWRRIPESDWAYRYPAQQRPTAAKGKCDRSANHNLTAHDLWVFHKHEAPQPLQGDRRSTKSNAMRGIGLGLEAQGSSLRSLQASGHKPQATPNPNRGVGFAMGHKILGLPATWQTTLRLERYIQHAKLKQHFLVCPVCGDGRTDIPLCHSARSGRADIPVCRWAQPNQDAIGGTSPPANKRGLPPGRVTKLYLTLCAPQEYHDAQQAHLWLRTFTHPNRPLTTDAVNLIERYGELFGPRQLRCRQCLGLRYGEVKSQPNAKRKQTTQLTKSQNQSRQPIQNRCPTPPPRQAPVDLPGADPDELLLELCQVLANFKALERVKQMIDQ